MIAAETVVAFPTWVILAAVVGGGSLIALAVYLFTRSSD